MLSVGTLNRPAKDNFLENRKDTVVLYHLAALLATLSPCVGLQNVQFAYLHQTQVRKEPPTLGASTVIILQPG
jgi:hypothetical protein